MAVVKLYPPQKTDKNLWFLLVSPQPGCFCLVLLDLRDLLQLKNS